MHVGVVIPDVSFGAAVRHRAESKRWGIVVGSLKLEREAEIDRQRTEGGGEKEVSHHSVSCQELHKCMHQHRTAKTRSFLCFLPTSSHLPLVCELQEVANSVCLVLYCLCPAHTG